MRRAVVFPRRADEHSEFAVADGQVELLHGPTAVRIDLRQPLELNLSYRAPPPREQLGKILPSRPRSTVYDPGRGGSRHSRFHGALAGRLRARRFLGPLLIAPAVLFIVLLVGAPLVLAVYLSLTDATADR